MGNGSKIVSSIVCFGRWPRLMDALIGITRTRTDYK